MKTSIWYHTVDKQPDKSGHYLSYRGWGMGGKADGDSDHGYLYYRKQDNKWYEYENSWLSSFPEEVAFVYYWTDADPAGWVENDPPIAMRKKQQRAERPALKEAWKNIQEAIDRYEVLKALTNDYKP